MQNRLIKKIWNHVELLKICKSAFHLSEFSFYCNYTMKDNNKTLFRLPELQLFYNLEQWAYYNTYRLQLIQIFRAMK